MRRLYARRAQQHWARWRPQQLRQIPDPERFFTELGARVEAQVDQLTTDLAGPDLPGEGYLAKLGRLRMARFTAEAQVLRDLVLLPDEQDQDQDQDWTAPADLPAAPSTSGPDLGGLPTVLRPDHPRYPELDGDPGLRPA
jgi:hypothetical protein